MQRLFETYQFDLIVGGKRGKLKQRRPNDNCDQFDGYGYE